MIHIVHYNDVIMSQNGVSSNQRLHCLLNRLLRGISKKTSKLRVTGLSARKFPAQKASNTENGSIALQLHAISSEDI